jgi:hypothetical protein
LAADENLVTPESFGRIIEEAFAKKLVVIARPTAALGGDWSIGTELDWAWPDWSLVEVKAARASVDGVDTSAKGYFSIHTQRSTGGGRGVQLCTIRIPGNLILSEKRSRAQLALKITVTLGRRSHSFEHVRDLDVQIVPEGDPTVRALVDPKMDDELRASVIVTLVGPEDGKQEAIIFIRRRGFGIAGRLMARSLGGDIEVARVSDPPGSAHAISPGNVVPALKAAGALVYVPDIRLAQANPRVWDVCAREVELDPVRLFPTGQAAFDYGQHRE